MTGNPTLSLLVCAALSWLPASSGWAQTITQSEPDDSIGTANATALTAGSSGLKVVYGHTGDGPYGAAPAGNETGDVDFYKVSAAAGQTIFVNMANAGIDPDFDPYAAIYSSTGAMLVESDDKGTTSRGYDRTPRLAYKTTSAGDFYVCISNWIADSTSLPSDPLTPGTAPGLASGHAGPYQVIIGLDAEAPVPQFVGGSTGYPVPAFLPGKVFGTPRYDGVLTISNRTAGTTAAASLVISGYSVSGPDASRFSVSGLATPATIPPGGELNVAVSFNAGGSGQVATATLNFTSNDPLNQGFVLNTSGSPVVGGGNFTVRQVNAPAGTTVNSWEVADQLLDGSISGSTEFSGTSPGINYGPGTSGRFPADVPFLNGGTDPNNCVVQVTGTFRIRTAGIYTFLGRSDDGQRLAIDGTVINEYTDYDADHFYTANLTAGNHILEFTMYEGGGGNNAELSISQQPGTWEDFIDSTWELLEAAGSDSDGDSLPNDWEVANGLNPESAAGTNGATGDPDADGSTNLDEYTRGTNPQNADTDGDGLKDGVENKAGSWASAGATGTDPLRADTDRDGLNDGTETPGAGTGSDPNKLDSDGDGYADLTEITLGTNAMVATSNPDFVFQPLFSESFEAPSAHSEYLFTRGGGDFSPDVTESGVTPQGKVAQLTDATLSNNNSIAWDLVTGTPSSAAQLTFDFRITPNEGDTDPADGFGIGLFRTSTWGSAGASNPGLAPPYWENPATAPGFANSLQFGFGVYGTDMIRMSGPAAPGTLLYEASPAFGLANGLFNRVIITVHTNGSASSMVTMEVIEDVNGAATRRVIFENLLVPGFTVGTESFRLIAGGRTGASVARVDLDNVSLSTPAANTPTLVLSTTPQSVLGSLIDSATVAVNPSSVQATLNGAAIAVQTSKTGTVTSIDYTAPAGQFLPPGTSTLVISYRDATGSQLSESRPINPGTYTVLPASLVLPSSSGITRGLNVRTVQMDPLEVNGAAQTMPNSLDYHEGILDGVSGSPFTGGNVASVTGATDGWFLSGVINFEQEAIDPTGWFGGDSGIPGIPGTTGNTDNYSFEALTWVNFPTAGLYRFGVTADDGMRVSYGHDPVPAVSVVAPADAARIVPYLPSIRDSQIGGIAAAYPNPPIEAEVVMADPPTATDTTTQAGLLNNAAAVAGKILLIDRGAGTFVTKIRTAQAAGALAAIIVNANNPDSVPAGLGGDGSDLTTITIPAGMIAKSDGDALKALIGSGLRLRFGTDNTTTLGKADLNTTTEFTAAVPAPGLYPLRLMNFEGGGGANCEWYSIASDGVRHLINDSADPDALQAFATVGAAGPQPVISIATSGGSIVVTYTGVLQSSPDLVNFTDVPGAASPFTVPANGPTRLFFRARP